MTGYAAQIAEAEAKQKQVEAKLEEIEALKVLEPKLRREVAQLTAKIAELKEESKADREEKSFFGAEVEEEEVAPLPVKTPPAKIRDAEGEKKAKMKAINKKLKQIEGLKEKDGLDADQQAKVASEPKLRKQLAAMEAGEEYVDSDKEEEPEPIATNFKQAKQESDNEAETVKLPTDPAEVEKRVKTLKKKLQQIAKLKEKGGALDDDAKQKIAGEDRINQEIAALEEGKDEVTFVEKTADDIKVELEKKVKNVTKKLEQIQKLKKDGNLDADAQAKVNSEAALKKEQGELTRQIGDLNKKERDRVAERLGWEGEAPKKKGGKK